MIQNISKYSSFLLLYIILNNNPVNAKKIEYNHLYHSSQIYEVEFSQVKIQDDFWLPKIKLVQTVTIPHLLDIAEEEGKLDNFRIISGQKKGKIKLHNAGDSDVYKLIEAAAYSFSSCYDSILILRIDQLIEDIAAAQQPDGYINTQFTLPDDHPCSPNLDTTYVRRFGYGLKDRWNSTLERWPYAYSQLYCSGHLMEAAVAYYRATGKISLLDVALKNARHIKEVFTLDKIKSYADHPQVEIGLIKLFEVTGNPDYQQLAENFSRYLKFARPRDIVLTESSKPLAEQREAYSHCVRTGYIYTSATSCIRINGSEDLKSAIHSIWNNLIGRKIYIHGGIGNGTKFEQHGHDFDLPILNTYSESCAQVAQCQWNHELNLLSGSSKYADIIEWEAYNGALSGFGLDGRTFLYSNKLNIDTIGRKDYHTGVRTSYLFCCPSKLPGFISGINRWIYAKDLQNLYVNMFVGSQVTTSLGDEKFTLQQETKYPWEGKIQFTVHSNTKSDIGIKIRIPSWNSKVRPLAISPYYFEDELQPGLTVTLNGKKLSNLNFSDGYITIKRKFKKNDIIIIDLEMPVRRIYTDNVVKANNGRIALSRGPMLYTLEGVDNNFNVLEMVLPRENKISEKTSELFKGSVVLLGTGLIQNKEVKFMAIPYHLWQNRGIHSLSTLIIENPELIQIETQDQEEINTDG